MTTPGGAVKAPSDHSDATDAVEISIVVPTFNERSNVEELLSRVEAALGRAGWEIVFVDDDSIDGTSTLVRQIAQRDRRVRILQRIGRRGLSSACIEGMMAAAAPIIAVMDADLQHDETRLPVMMARLLRDEADLVIATRYADGGGTGDWEATRAGMSRLATKLSHLVLRRAVSDPMSGFFMLRRHVLENTVHGLSGVGFKILLDILATSTGPLRIVEVPFTFRRRFSGDSKLDTAVLWDFVMLLVDKTIGTYVPARFVMFGFVGIAGVVIHMLVLAALLQGAELPFTASQAWASGAAMVFNFAVNNAVTYGDRRLRRWRWFRGLVSFMLFCSVGAVANVGVANYLFVSRTPWAWAALAGVAVGAVWNFAVTQAYTWAGPGGRR
jgi:dolichol-phosphate mannosyltransferase